MNESPFELQPALEARGALLRGHFLLSSGRHSDRFVQKFRVLEDPALLEPVAAALAAQFANAGVTVVVSAAVGGIVLGYEVARQLGTKAIFVEKEQGVPALRRGFALGANDRALIVEDVVTTGLSVREVIDVVRGRGAQVAGIGVIVQRGDVDLPLQLHALLHLPMVSYEPADCPQCRAGEPITDPGSRRA